MTVRMTLVALTLTLSSMMPQQDRVAAARREKTDDLQVIARNAGLRYPFRRLFLRSIKDERILEVWGSNEPSGPLRPIITYPVAGQSGTLGPKRREGDRQVPEGVYFIDRFNPLSAFHLSLGVNYPNASDRILSDPIRPGGDIFIHGDNKSIGCLAITDDKIKELYLMCLDARASGQRQIPVHFFPSRLTPAGLQRLSRTNRENRPLIAFWENLAPIYRAFESTRVVPRTRVLKDGRYELLRSETKSR
ncbi:MAG: L,D-transpeptidase family protein [Fimbriimonadaceae bacterium]|jgi:murein L,D-transpeptidase YafK|nr:L,D-transpeptidase family protein [Fimbriimonadaceae bacterium]